MNHFLLSSSSPPAEALPLSSPGPCAPQGGCPHTPLTPAAPHAPKASLPPTSPHPGSPQPLRSPSGSAPTLAATGLSTPPSLSSTGAWRQASASTLRGAHKPLGDPAPFTSAQQSRPGPSSLRLALHPPFGPQRSPLPGFARCIRGPGGRWQGRPLPPNYVSVSVSRRQGRRDRQGEEDEDEEEEPDLSHRGGAGRAGWAARGTSTPARAAWPRPPRTARVWGSEDTLCPAALGDRDTAECENFSARRG